METVQKAVVRVSWIVAALLITSCIKTEEQKLASVSDGLRLVGSVVDENGKAISGAAIRVEAEDRILATSDASGSFTLTLSRTRVKDIGHSLLGQRKSFYVYFSAPTGKLIAASSAISVDDIGERDLGQQVLTKSATVIGKIYKADSSQILTPAIDAKLTVGPSRAVIKADGTFTAEGVPSGKIAVGALVPGLNPHTLMIDVYSGLEQNLKDPVIVFSGVGPQGVLIESENRSLKDLVTSGHPTSKRFKVFSDVGTRFVRYHHDIKALQALSNQDLQAQDITKATEATSTGTNSTATPAIKPTLPQTTVPGATHVDIPWVLVGNEIDYDFPGNGGQVIFYQFSDPTKTKFSKIYMLAATVDVFADSTGISFGSGENYVSPSSRVPVKVSVPVAAVSMRLVEDLKELKETPWRPVSAEFQYDFRPKAGDLATLLGGEPMVRQLYAQFRDAYGNDSNVFSAFASMRVFPDLTVTIGDGSGLVTSQVVPVTVNMPADTLYIRMTESETTIKTAEWRQASAQNMFQFIPTLEQMTGFLTLGGNREICIQLKDRNGFVSQVVCQSVMVDLFSPQDSAGFVVTDRLGNPTPVSTSNLVDLMISVPENAAEMRIYENAPTSQQGNQNGGSGYYFGNVYSVGGMSNYAAEQGWMAVNSAAVFNFPTAGNKVLMLQFRTRGGLVSPIYQAAVTIIPFSEAPAQFMINSAGPGSSCDPAQHLNPPTVVNPVLDIDLMSIPFSATGVAVSIDEPRPIISPNLWQPIPADNRLQSPMTTKGIKTIWVQFKNADNQFSQAYKCVVYYDPFPSELVSMAVNNGVNTTATREIPVVLTAPSTATEILMATSPAGLVTTGPWKDIPANNQMEFELPATEGNYKIYYILKSVSGDISPMFETGWITYDTTP